MGFREIGQNRALVTWELPADDLRPYQLTKYRPLSVVVEGEFNGGQVHIVGTNDPGEDPKFFTLNDPQGNPLSFFKGKIEQILEDCVQIKPYAIGNVKVKVYLLLAIAR